MPLPPLGIFDGVAAGAASSFESIATVTVGSGGASSISFTSIPGTYTHLQIRALALTGSGQSSGDLRYRANSDSGTNYISHYMEGNGSSVGAGVAMTSGATNYGSVGQVRGGNTYPDVFVCDILDYANTNKYKTFRSLAGDDQNGSGLIAFRSSLWMSTSAITSIEFTLLSSLSFTNYSHFGLYGIKSA